MTANPPDIAVIGSINMDLVVRCALLPEPGETILAESSVEVCGGKGANQAVAAARAGGNVTMIGRVGNDAFAGRLVDNLRHEQICTDAIHSTANCASGLAIVAVEQSGQNSIMVVPGANGHVDVEDVQASQQVIAASQIVLLQLEIPADAVLAALRIAREAGVRVILDPAPALPDWPADLFNVDVLCPNESEAAALLGCPIESLDDVAAGARKLHQLGVRHAAITLGARGTMVCDGGSPRLIEPFAVTAVDTTAAGDAFAGALAVRWSEGASFSGAIQFANAAGALAASREGAQPGMPHRNTIDTLLKK
jgi:ribokinase